MCARIISNMSKLVEDPIEAKPFLAELIPAIEEAIDTISDPEAREVAEKTLLSLIKIETNANSLSRNKEFLEQENINNRILFHLNLKRKIKY